MTITVKQLTDRLGELPDDWEVVATKSGRSLQVHEPTAWHQTGHRFGYVFTDTDRPIQYQTARER